MFTFEQLHFIQNKLNLLTEKEQLTFTMNWLKSIPPTSNMEKLVHHLKDITFFLSEDTFPSN